MSPIFQAGGALPANHPAAGKEMVAIDGSPRATTYVCVGQTCGLPLVDADALRAYLAEL